MKNYFLIVFFILLLSCTNSKKHVVKKDIIINDSIENVYGHLPKDSINVDSLVAQYRWLYNYEKISTKIIYGDTTRFIYYHKNFMDYTDTLTIYKPDSIVFGNQLKVISKKNIRYNGKPLIIRKYSDKENFYSGNIIYLNDSLGLILCKYGQNIIMYNTNKFSKIHHAIVNDGVFFNRWQ